MRYMTVLIHSLGRCREWNPEKIIAATSYFEAIKECLQSSSHFLTFFSFFNSIDLMCSKNYYKANTYKKPYF